MRGVPGSGKSHLALRLAGGDSSKVFSTDDYFSSLPGGYKANWKVEKLFPAHKWNQGRVRKALSEGIDPVIVDNTNLKSKDARVYYDMAIEHGYEVRIEESQSPWWLEITALLKNKKGSEAGLKKWAGKLAHGFMYEELHIKNEHGVPEDTIYNMLLKYQFYTVEDLAR
jgi:predicted kinase